MNLRPTDRIWMPQDQPEYLLVSAAPVPHDRELFLLAQADLLDRLVEEASPEELEDQSNRIRNNLEWEVLDFLPGKLLLDPRCPSRLFLNPMLEGSPMHEWKVGIEEALQAPQANPEEAREEAEGLSLESFLSRLL